MFHQTSTINKGSYKQALLSSKTPLNISIKASKKKGTSSCWGDAAERLMQQSGMHGKIDPNWVLLDIQSTINVFCNADLLINIRKANRVLDIYSTAGENTTDMIGDLPGFGMAWLYDDSIANILSLSKVAEHFKVT